MLPTYTAVSAVEIIHENIGRTKPWVVVVDTGNNTFKKYVVKLFTTHQNDVNHSISKEVVGNIMAQSFDLNVPQAALIEFSNDFELTLKPDFQLQYAARDERIKFGVELVDSTFRFESGLSKQSFKKLSNDNIDTLYAFDNLIRNADRGGMKSNLFFAGRNMYLIDHELAFNLPIPLNTFENISWESGYRENHLCYRYLKRAHTDTKNHYFHLFNEYFRVFNPRSLDSYFDQLQKFGYQTNRIDVNNYLNFINNNFVNFTNSLKVSVK